MWPILACSIAATAITIERFWALNRRAVTPGNLWQQVQQLIEQREFDHAKIRMIRDSSPLGRILGAVLINIRGQSDIGADL